jgi:hypothetical protein
MEVTHIVDFISFAFWLHSLLRRILVATGQEAIRNQCATNNM